MKLNPELEDLFHKLADLDPKQRALYFEEHSVDPGVRREVEALITCDQSGQPLDTWVNLQVKAEVENILKTAQEFSENTLFGPYKLLKRIGQGGMSEVWLAERTDGFLKRPVALKLPYAGLRASHFAERLYREKDILASLVHPGIARLYDAGVVEDGRPFLALEFVEGLNLSAYCDEHALPIRNRLELFLQVLSAVQYAHSHLVIHRDLKPSNILVTEAAEIKLLDFGIAKLMIQGEALETELTQLGGRALTLSYASPEQIAGQPVTIASDVFSLGQILFELLSGERAFVPARNTQAALEEAILQGDPRRLSQCVSSETHSQERSTTPRKLSAQLKGDLDLIVLKALQRTPDQRYSTVDAFRADIGRYLAGEAVLAQPESTRYRVKKFVLRHKLPVLSAAAIFLTFAAGLSAALWQARIARDQARTSAAVEEFTEDIFRTNSVEQPDPVKAQQTTARQLLDIGARKVAGKLNDAPEAKLRMLAILGSLYLNLGLEDQSVALEKQRVALAKTLHGARSVLVVPALIDLGVNMHASNAVNESSGVLLEAKSILDARGDSTSKDRARLCWALAELYQSSDIPKSLDFAKESIKIYRSFPPTKEHAQAYYVAGVSYANSGNFEQSAASLGEAIALSKRFDGDPNSDLARYYAYEGQAENSLHKYAAAEQDFRNALKYAKIMSGEDDVDTIETGSRLGMFLVLTSRPKQALEYLEKAKETCLKIKGPKDPFYTPQVLLQYGRALEANGRPEEALRYISEAVENRRRNRPGTRYLAQMIEDQALVLTELGRYAEAEKLLLESEQIHTKVGEKLDVNYFSPRLRLTLAKGDLESMDALLDRYYGAPSDSAGLSGAYLSNMENRAELALRRNDGKSAIALAQRLAGAIDSSQQQLYLGGWRARAMLHEAEGRLMEHDASGALPLIQRSAQLEADILDPSSPALARADALLGIAYLESGDRNKAAELLAKAKAILRAHPELNDRYLQPVRDLSQRLGSQAKSACATWGGASACQPTAN